jgi:hypothetical protein
MYIIMYIPVIIKNLSKIILQQFIFLEENKREKSGKDCDTVGTTAGHTEVQYNFFI